MLDPILTGAMEEPSAVVADTSIQRVRFGCIEASAAHPAPTPPAWVFVVSHGIPHFLSPCSSRNPAIVSFALRSDSIQAPRSCIPSSVNS